MSDKKSRTVEKVVSELGSGVAARMAEHFRQAGLHYPPDQITLLAIKESQILELWCGHGTDRALVKTYDVQAASGVPGPKLREGDRQVPEGKYQIAGLNPNSAYHLSMKLNYPNAFDRKWADREGREFPGSNIFIHGAAVSVGCLAMGNRAIEELFVLVALVGMENVNVVIAPCDPRIGTLSKPDNAPGWVFDLYREVSKEFAKFQRA